MKRIHYWRNLHDRLKERNRLSQFLILLNFVLTFIIIRVVTYLQKLKLLPNQVGELHIHHLVPGIFMILISGYISISFWNRRKLRLMMAIFFGIGAALTIDEFALWLFLKDVYWETEGRISVDAVILTATIFGLVFLISESNDHRWVKKVLR